MFFPCYLLTGPAPDRIALARDLAALATLARAAAMALCAPEPATVLAEIGKLQ